MSSPNTSAVIELPARGGLADWAGMIASIGCAIHCAAMPLVLAYLPALGLGWLASEGFHQWMAVICFVLAASAFVPGWRKHGSFLPAVWGAAGILLLTTAAFALEDGCCAVCGSTDQTSVEQQVSIGRCSVNQATLAGSHLECECCASTETEQVSGVSLSVASLTPFVTPLGGLLLVVGHILNHIKSCRCQGNTCCLPNGGESQMSKSQ